jgi:hypothetical protein
MRQTCNIVFLGLFVLAGCQAPQNIVETSPVRSGDSLSPAGYAYSLPQTTFRLTVEVIKTRTIRGPYYRFAEKLLNIKDVPQRNSDSYRISGLRLESFEEADPGHWYMVRQVSGETDLTSLLRLDREGLIFDRRQTGRDSDETNLPRNGPAGPIFTELSMEKNRVMSIDTFYKTILTDTSFIRVPVMQEQLLVKTFDEKAEEAADFILELRYERFMMLTGNNATPVSDDGVRRLDEIEREYLELFIGKTYEEKYRYTYYVTPEGYEPFENFELFEFSNARGVLREKSPDSEALSLSIRNTNKTELLKGKRGPGRLPARTNALYYRVPDLVEIEVSLGGETMLRERWQVSQFGKILALPVGAPVE